MNAISHSESTEPTPPTPSTHSQAGLERLILPPPVSLVGSGQIDIEADLIGRLRPGTVLMMGDNPALPQMPARPQLLDFFKYRFTDITVRHLLTSGKRALDDGQDEKIVLGCLLHDIANGCLLRSDHGYWGAQLIAPYVSEEIAWAVQNHQALRYYADESVNYQYPESYVRFFGQTLGGESVETNEFGFPVNVCRGCLVAFPRAEMDPNLPEPNCGLAGAASSSSSTSVPCVIGQDLTVDCSVVTPSASTGTGIVDAGGGG